MNTRRAGTSLAWLLSSLLMLNGPIVSAQPPAPPPNQVRGDQLPTAQAPTPKAPALTPDEAQEQLHVLESEALRTDLRITPEQQAKLRALLAEARLDVQAIRNGAPVRGAAAPEGIAGKYRAMMEQVLTDEQKLRLGQLFLRLAGYKAVLEPRVAETLRIDDQQAARIRDVVAEHEQLRRDTLRQHRREFRGKEGRLARRDLRRQLDDDRDRAIRGLLTDRQRIQFEKMLGEKSAVDAIPESAPEATLGEPEPSRSPDADLSQEE